ncbi:hypothetical protein [Thermococcus sp.]|uniref:hypothetical protein n=1 Tax=Thermococcus sp. TaxID=35749 RepID=UPI00261CE16C|nr:hypothetical protein [Thermococcus sp.]
MARYEGSKYWNEDADRSIWTASTMVLLPVAVSWEPAWFLVSVSSANSNFSDLAERISFLKDLNDFTKNVYKSIWR